MGTVVDISYRYKDKKNREWDPIIEQKIDVLRDWFKSRWPEAELDIKFLFSRIYGEELEIKRDIRYRTKKTKHVVSSMTTIHNHTWRSPYYMGKFLDGFVQDQMRAIGDIMRVAGVEEKEQITNAE